MDNIRIRAIEGERKGKGYAKDGERRRGRGGTGPGNRNERRGSEPVKWCTKRGRGGGGRVAAPSCSCRFRPHVRARGPRARAGPDVGVLFLFLSFSLDPFLSIYLSRSLLSGRVLRARARPHAAGAVARANTH